MIYVCCDCLQNKYFYLTDDNFKINRYDASIKYVTILKF